MAKIVDIILQSGKSAIELSLYVLLPIMVVMMAFMKLLEVKGVLAFIARLLSPLLKPFGIPGIGVFAILQSLLVRIFPHAAFMRRTRRMKSDAYGIGVASVNRTDGRGPQGRTA